MTTSSVHFAPTGYQDTFARDHLPPAGEWPTLEFTTELLRYPERLNAATEIIDVSIERFGADRPALVTADGSVDGEVWTYGELRTRANQIAHVLVDDLGLVTGNRVLLRSPNNPWTVAAWLGVLKAGGIVVTTMAALRARELEPIVTKTRPAIALVDHRYLEDVHAVSRNAAPDLKIVSYGADTADDLTRRILDKPGNSPRRTPRPTTSRCSRPPRAVPACRRSPRTSIATCSPSTTPSAARSCGSCPRTWWPAPRRSPSPSALACSSPSSPLRAGAAAAFLAESATPVRLAEMVARHGVTVLATAPTAYKQILGAGRAEDLKGLRAVVSAGEHIPKNTWEQLRDTVSLKIIDGIGATEMLHIFISAAGEDIRPGATGKPVPGYRATILDEAGHEVGPGVPGRLAVIGPVGCRYLDDDRQRGYVLGGWNLTGDVFLKDEDGYFWYQARNDSMIVSSGYNIGAPEVESVLDTHPDVVESAVVGKPDPDRGSIVCAFVALRPDVAGDQAKARELQDYVKGQLAPYKYPREVRFVASLPRNSSGKVQHFKLRELLAAQLTEQPTAQAGPAPTTKAAE